MTFRPFHLRKKRAGQAGISTGQTILLVLAILALAFASYRLWTMSGTDRVSYPYWCKDCKAVFDVSELGKDPENWKMPPGARSDSVVYCLRCKTGSAYPAVPCHQCGTVHVLHLWKNSDCPKCNPEIAQAAAAEGIDLTPPELR